MAAPNHAAMIAARRVIERVDNLRRIDASAIGGSGRTRQVNAFHVVHYGVAPSVR